MNALDAVKAGSMKSACDCADCRCEAGQPAGVRVRDGAAAIMVGQDDVVAELEATYSLSVDFVDRWAPSMRSSSTAGKSGGSVMRAMRSSSPGHRRDAETAGLRRATLPR